MSSTRNALVTGANKGLGLQVCRELVKLGVEVIACSRNPRLGAAAADTLAKEGNQVATLTLDVTDAGQIATAADWVKKRYGRLDILINNAGFVHHVDSLDYTAEDMRTQYETNLFSVVEMTRAFLPLLQAASAPRIVNVSSTTASHAFIGQPENFLSRSRDILGYSSSKAAMNMVTQHYANAFRERADYAHIKVNAVTPGYIATDLNQNQGNRTVEQGAKVVIEFATIGPDGPSGGYFNDEGPLPW